MPDPSNSCALPEAPVGGELRCAGQPCHTRLATHAIVTLHCVATNARLVGVSHRTCQPNGMLSPHNATVSCRDDGSVATTPLPAAATAAIDTTLPIRLALRSMSAVLSGMLRVEATAAKLSKDLTAEMATLELTWKRQAAQVKLLMTADAQINNVAIGTLNTADYGLPLEPRKAPRGRAMSRALEACALATRVAKGVARLLVRAGVAPKPKGAMDAALGGVTDGITDGARRLAEARAALHVDTNSFVGSGAAPATRAALPSTSQPGGDITTAIATVLAAPASTTDAAHGGDGGSGSGQYTQSAVAAAPNPAAAAALAKLASLKRSATASKTQAAIDEEVIGFLKQLVQRDTEREVQLAHKTKTEQLAYERDARRAGTPLARALTAVGHAVVKLHRAFSGVLSRAKQLGDCAAAAAGAIERARVMGVADVRGASGVAGGAAARRLVWAAHHHHPFSNGARASRAAAKAAQAALGGPGAIGGGVDDPFVKSPALRHVAALFANAHATLRDLHALQPGLQGQYDRVRSLLLREARRLRHLRTEPAAKALQTALHDPGFMALCREYSKQLHMKAETKTLVRRVHRMIALGGGDASAPAGGGASAEDPASSTAGDEEDRRRLRVLPGLSTSALSSTVIETMTASTSALSSTVIETKTASTQGWRGFTVGALGGVLLHIAVLGRLRHA